MTGPKSKPAERPSLEAVLAAAARLSGFNQELIRGRRTERGLSGARQVTMLIMAERCGATYPQIGDFMDRRCPQAVHKAADLARERLHHSAALRELHGRLSPGLPGGLPARPQDPRKLPRRRRCLMCREGFESGHAGHRVCAKCKTSKLWQSGGGCSVYPGTPV